MSTTILTSADCETAWQWEPVMKALRAAHVEHYRGEAEQPVPTALGPGGPEARRLVPMVAAAPARGLIGVKMLVDAPANRRLGLPAQRSTAAVFSTDTGECLALVDGMALTRLRTAAMTAIATQALAIPGARTLGLIGAGALARAHLEALREVRPIDRVLVWSRSAQRGAEFAEFAASLGVAATIVDTPAAAAAADIVCTLTPSTVPLLHGDALAPGAHLNALGSPPRPGFREISPDVLAAADRIVVDVRTIALAESGNIRDAIAAGAIEEGDLIELGPVLAQDQAGRRGADEITVFNSIGVGLQDLAAIWCLIELAAHAGVGRSIELR